MIDETFDPEAPIDTQECTLCEENFLPELDLQAMCEDCMETLPLNEVIGRAV